MKAILILVLAVAVIPAFGQNSSNQDILQAIQDSKTDLAAINSTIISLANEDRKILDLVLEELRDARGREFVTFNIFDLVNTAGILVGLFGLILAYVFYRKDKARGRDEDEMLHVVFDNLRIKLRLINIYISNLTTILFKSTEQSLHPKINFLNKIEDNVEILKLIVGINILPYDIYSDVLKIIDYLIILISSNDVSESDLDRINLIILKTIVNINKCDKKI